MGKAPKSTKKFQKNHLKRTVDQRRLEQKYKQKFQKGKKYGAKDDPEEEPSGPVHNENEVFEDGSVETFFNSNTDNLSIDVPKKKSKSKSKSNQEDPKESTGKLTEEDPELSNYLNEDVDEDINIESKTDIGDLKEGFEDVSDYSDEEDLTEITVKTVKTWKKSLETKNSVKTIKKVASTFKAASKASEAVIDADTHDELISLAVKTLPSAILHNCPVTTSKKGTTYVSTDTKRFKVLSSALKNYASALASLLSTTQDKELIALVLENLHTLFPFFLSFKKQVKGLVDAAVQLWGTSDDAETREASIAFLRAIADEHTKHVIEIVLKSSYDAILKNSLKSSPRNTQVLNFQKDSASVLFEIDPTVSYDLGFQFVRQLALHLRSSIVNKSPEAYKTIYNWQFVHSLDFWSRIVSSQCEGTKEAYAGKTSPFRELIYPLVQVILGTIRLIPSPQYFPLRFYLIRSLLRLAHATGVYIPLIPMLIEILSSSTIAKYPKHSALDALDFETTIRAPKAYLGTKVYQEGVCDEFTDLASEFFAQHSKSIAFPELSTPIVIAFKRFIARSEDGRFNKQLSRLVEKLEENNRFIQQKRNGINFSPTNKTEAAMFLKDFLWEKTPFGNFVVIQRQVRLEKARAVRKRLESSEGLSRASDSESLEDSDEDMSD